MDRGLVFYFFIKNRKERKKSPPCGASNPSEELRRKDNRSLIAEWENCNKYYNQLKSIHLAAVGYRTNSHQYPL